MKKIKTKLLSALIILSITIPQTVTFADGVGEDNDASVCQALSSEQSKQLTEENTETNEQEETASSAQTIK